MLKNKQITARLAALAIAVALACAFACAGCQSLRNAFSGSVESERNAYKTAEELYASTLNTLSDLREAGRISDEDMEDIERVRRVARKALDGWRLALENEDEPEKAVRKFYEAISQLTVEIDRSRSTPSGT